jgi:PAS domain S-box-containing protein
LAWLGVGLVALAALRLLAVYSYLLFHVLAEGFVIVVACATFLVVWHVRRTMASGFLTLLGSAYLCVAALDLAHTLAYRGMGVLVGDLHNQAIQAWLIARWIEAGSLLVSFRFLGRSVSMQRALGVYLGLLAGSLGLIVLGWFPDCYVDGELTAFKIVGEFAVIAMLLGAMVLTFQTRRRFPQGLVVYLYAAILLTVAAEVFFVTYRDPMGVIPIIGHLCKVASFWMIYRLLIESTLRRPYSLLYRDLKQSQEDLGREREFLRALVDHTPLGIAALDNEDFRIRLANEAFCGACGVEASQVRTKCLADVLAPSRRQEVLGLLQEAVESGHVRHRPEVLGFFSAESSESFWSVYAVPLRGASGNSSLLLLVQDMTSVVRQRRGFEELSRTLERRVEERTAEAETRTAQLREMALELTRAEQRERRRLASVLHDHLQQLLVGAKFRVQAISAKSEAPADALEEIQDLLDDSLEVSRSATYELYPPMLHEEGLAAGLHWLSNWMGDKYELDVSLDLDPEACMKSQVLQMFLFQAARELLFNVVKHGQTKNASIWLAKVSSDRLEMTVTDEGKGFCPEELDDADGEEAGGFGLRSIRERIEFLGGTFEADSAESEGTRIRLEVPLDCETRHQEKLMIEAGGQVLSLRLSPRKDEDDAVADEPKS